MNLVAQLKAYLNRVLPKRSFARNVSVLVGGTAVAQMISVLVLPVITRLYTPEDFSALAVYMSLLSMISVIACLRLEIAIPLPSKDNEAGSLLLLSLFIAITISLLTAIVLSVFHSQVIHLVHNYNTVNYLWLLPFGVLISALYAVFQLWSTRKRKFHQIARTRINQAIGGTGIQVIGGIFGVGPIGLLLGSIFSSGAGFVGLSRDAWKQDKAILQSVTRQSMLDVFKRYSKFPKYSTIEALANTAGSQLPIIIIAAANIGAEAGYLMLAMRIMAAPMGLLGGAVAQVYLAQASIERQTGNLSLLTINTLNGLIKSGVGPLMFVGVVAAPLAGVVLGHEWSRCGELMAWMTPWFILQFLSSPISMVMHVTERQPLMLAVTATGGAVRIMSVLVASAFFSEYLAEVFAVGSAIVYLAYFFIFFHASGVRIIELFTKIVSNFSLLIAWFLSASVTSLLIAKLL